MSLDGDRCRFKLFAEGLRRASAAAIIGSGWTSLDLLGPGLEVSIPFNQRKQILSSLAINSTDGQDTSITQRSMITLGMIIIVLPPSSLASRAGIILG
jgi:hypothetical protein